MAESKGQSTSTRKKPRQATTLAFPAPGRLDAGHSDFESSARLATIVESSDDAIICKNLDGIVITWNRSAERLFGYRAAEIIGKSIVLIIPRDRLMEEKLILQRLRRGERIDHYETIRQSKDGRLLNV